MDHLKHQEEHFEAAVLARQTNMPVHHWNQKSLKYLEFYLTYPNLTEDDRRSLKNLINYRKDINKKIKAFITKREIDDSTFLLDDGNDTIEDITVKKK